MNSRSHFALTLCVSLAVAGPALADMTRLGTVYIGPGTKGPVQFKDFGGGVDRIGLRAADSSADCTDVRMLFPDGKTYDAYRGLLEGGHEVDLLLPDGESTIRSIDFQCTGHLIANAAIDVLADPGKHQQEWRSNPDWNSKWWYRFQTK